MKKAYWITTYQSIKDPAKMEAYRLLAGPALMALGGRFIVRGMPEKIYERGQMERVVVIEFDSMEKAIAAHDSNAYQHALKVLDDGALRDIRFVEAV